MDFETRAIHEGQEPDPATGAVTVPIYQTSTYVQEAVGEHKGYDYSRTANPTRRALETCLASLESAEYGFGFSSGMGATTTIMHLVVAGRPDRRGERRLRRDVPPLRRRCTRRRATTFEFAPARRRGRGDRRAHAARLDRDADEPAAEHRRHRARSPRPRTRPVPSSCVDNTFATPYLQRPLELGADIVVHSTTKYLGGHSDLVGGFAATNDPTIAERLAFLQNSLGAVPGPFDSWLVLRGLKTLALRMQRHCENARAVAEFLEGTRSSRCSTRGSRTIPATSSPRGRCPVSAGWSHSSPSSAEEAIAIAAGTKIWKLAESLGGVESLIEVPAAMTHASTADASFAAPPKLVRLSVGIESADRPGRRPRGRARSGRRCARVARDRPRLGRIRTWPPPT